MELSDEAKKSYLKRGGVRCPFCGSDQIEGGHVEIDEGRAFQRTGCMGCDREWTDVYTLSDLQEDER